MKISKKHINQPDEAFVWIWLEDSLEPVVAGRLESHNGSYIFNYGKSYLELSLTDKKYIPIYLPELPLSRGEISLQPGLHMPGCIRDASPDAWGRRVLLNRKFGSKAKSYDTVMIDELTYLLESGSDRIGCLDFQSSPTHYIPRFSVSQDLEEIIESVKRVEDGLPLSQELDLALFHGTSIGGARPKALIEWNERKLIAKFSSASDIYSVVKSEFIAMKLAEISGIKVAKVYLQKILNKDVLLIERFDRYKVGLGWARKSLVSALTLFGLDEMMARYTSYEQLAEIIRFRFIKPKATLEELFKRLILNVLVGNTDDHARNHAAFWDGKQLELTPAYDICPQPRSGNEVSQAMLIHKNNRESKLSTCLKAAPQFLLSTQKAKDLIQTIKSSIEKNWNDVCDEAELSKIDRNIFWKRQFLNPYSNDV
ncbi:type II toxin-antitoxin system HipA family toxin [Leptospira sp. GIMC2001]|uniref:type II toxin-antitoxin system HipA family toxin n=1 Tax=Leptospira sp. GIMC2001 TaxID=1513297 RepID=UPI00234A3D4F|nr:HipA domain-containing protein [Leptospira sp. GIMC2001]WCL50159.1 HipA domain-containing protein [Leptospira sp. GIMC2001]